MLSKNLTAGTACWLLFLKFIDVLFIFRHTLPLILRYFIMKSQILESMGFTPKERFPVFADRMPNQLLAYIRLSRVQDPALFAKVSVPGIKE